MFDATKTDAEFKRDFVNQREGWMQNACPSEPDLDVEGLDQSLISRLLSALGLA